MYIIGKSEGRASADDLPPSGRCATPTQGVSPKTSVSSARYRAGRLTLRVRRFLMTNHGSEQSRRSDGWMSALSAAAGGNPGLAAPVPRVRHRSTAARVLFDFRVCRSVRSRRGSWLRLGGGRDHRRIRLRREAALQAVTTSWRRPPRSGSSCRARRETARSRGQPALRADHVIRRIPPVTRGRVVACWWARLLVEFGEPGVALRDRLPRAEPLRDVPPGAPSATAEDGPLDHLQVIAEGSRTAGDLRHQGRNPAPLGIAELLRTTHPPRITVGSRSSWETRPS